MVNPIIADSNVMFKLSTDLSHDFFNTTKFSVHRNHRVFHNLTKDVEKIIANIRIIYAILRDSYKGNTNLISCMEPAYENVKDAVRHCTQLYNLSKDKMVYQTYVILLRIKGLMEDMNKAIGI